ncbi:hypothetical protein [Flavobacterium chilense]|uniref:Cell wall assembly regulator SMI1 n=1 Tax=Flavobacterium chilense TaxID=946677 RepID=A0A1M7AJA1_9FLAO|nr:hypothetical protein [Flavobacterium chilense]SHL42798.1 hypothetical protein SAMN05444484_1011461 [Flavobacterium chilense]
MNNKLTILNQILKEINHPILQIFEESESEKDIENKLGKMKLEINKNLIDLYLWRGGVNGASVYDGTFEYFFSFGSFIDIGSAFSLLLLDRKTLKIYDKKLPFIQSLTGDTVSIDLSSKSSTRGMLLLFSPSLTLSSELMTVYDSIEKWIETIIECYKRNAYKMNSDGTLEIDYQLEKEISLDLNPLSDFWKS